VQLEGLGQLKNPVSKIQTCDLTYSIVNRLCYLSKFQVTEVSVVFLNGCMKYTGCPREFIVSVILSKKKTCMCVFYSKWFLR
jgi:hypothetical protein